MSKLRWYRRQKEDSCPLNIESSPLAAYKTLPEVASKLRFLSHTPRQMHPECMYDNIKLPGDSQ